MVITGNTAGIRSSYNSVSTVCWCTKQRAHSPGKTVGVGGGEVMTKHVMIVFNRSRSRSRTVAPLGTRNYRHSLRCTVGLPAPGFWSVRLARANVILAVAPPPRFSFDRANLTLPTARKLSKIRNCCLFSKVKIRLSKKY